VSTAAKRKTRKRQNVYELSADYDNMFVSCPIYLYFHVHVFLCQMSGICHSRFRHALDENKLNTGKQ
jgi:hypothetical protein